MYVYQSEEFAARSQDDRIAGRVQKFISKLEGYAGPVRVNGVPFFPGRYGPRYLKHEENAYRVVAELLHLEGEQVIYLHTIFFDHSTDYYWFIGEIKAHRAPYEPDPDAVRAYLRKVQAEESERIHKAEEPRPLPPEYEGWLKRSEWENDWVVYEGHEWVSRFRKKEYQGRWETLCEIVESVVSFVMEGNLPGQVAEKSGGVQIKAAPGNPYIGQAQKSDRFVLFSTHHVPLGLENDNPPQPEAARSYYRHVIFLLAPFNRTPSPKDVQDLIGDAYPFFEKLPEEELQFNDIAQCASRVYPCYIPLDPELWEGIEKEEGINLALSAEEENILFSLSSAGPQDYRLPIFINGRAGSGKSTILFYLFADYSTRLLDARQGKREEELGLKGLPLFLTYNQELLKVARDRVHRMLRTRLMGQHFPDELDIQIDSLLKPFREFLRELLPDEEDRSRFLDDSRRVTFHEFKRLYATELRLPDKRNYSPDLCWYVIRTLIKGYSLDGYLDPEGYADIPKKEQIIPLEEFTSIHSQIWRWYDRYLEEHKSWDDQDLIRAVLETGTDPDEEYTAVFCDEAQDFTRLELHFILQASIFSKYDLSGLSEIANLPFAFAGDPLQTLNPTGFRWASVQAMFYDQIIQEVDPQQTHGLRMNPLGDLKYNYRSTQPIVEVTNALLLLRNSLFAQGTHPQRYWCKGKESFVPQKFLLESIDLSLLKKSILDTIILVPCDEGGELSFIQEDEQLSKLYPMASLEEQPRNVLSAIGAKGLEFKRVILYKFGEYCPAKVWRQTTTQSQDIADEYFFNKLYVAATRATKWLFILDTQAGDQSLWSRVDEHSLLRYRQQAEKPEEWSIRPFQDEKPNHEFAVRAIKPGEPEGLKEISETEPELVAKEFKDKGIAAGNPDYLRRARDYYLSLNDPEEADFCEGYALKFENNLRQAGQVFVRIGRLELARDCFWEGDLWWELLSLEGSIRIEEAGLARFMVTERSDSQALLEFTVFLEDNITEETLPKAFSRQWRNVIADYRKRVQAFIPDTFTREDWNRLGQVLEELQANGYQESLSAAGRCYFNGDNLRQALQCWEECQANQHRDYYSAKARSLTYPQDLEWWDKAGDQDQIYREWQDHGGLEKQPEVRVLRLVAPVLEKKKRYWDACQAYIRIPDSDVKKVIGLLNHINQFTPGMIDNTNEAQLLLSYLCSHDQWAYLTSLLDKLSKATKDNKKRSEIRREVIRLLAKAPVTDDLLNTDTRQKLYRELIRPMRDNPTMRKGINFERELGPAVETLGFDISLSFYEKFVEDDLNPGLRDYARKRWLANAEMKKNYRSEHNEDIHNVRLSSDYQRRKRDWIFPETPEKTEQTDIPSKPEGVLQAMLPVKGLPKNVKVQETSEGQIEFRLGDVKFTIYRTLKIIKLEDSELRSLLFKLAVKEIQPLVGFEVIQENTPDGRIFSIPNWQMAGKLFTNDSKIILEIAPNGLDAPITIEF